MRYTPHAFHAPYSPGTRKNTSDLRSQAPGTRENASDLRPQGHEGFNSAHPSRISCPMDLLMRLAGSQSGLKESQVCTPLT